MKNKILVTGGAGYIGSKLSYDLTDMGFKVVVFDNLSTGSKKLLNKKAKFYKLDISKSKNLKKIIKKEKINIIFHLAASLDVNESMKKPMKYYLNNVVGTENLLKSIHGNKSIRKFIFSSTCAVYGNVEKELVDEKNNCSPVSHYGSSKLVAEKIIENYIKKNNCSAAILRYFNVIGADYKLRTGIIKPSNQLVKKLSNNIKNKNYTVNIFGNDYSTKDGTCIRDYIDVNDLSKIHIDVMKKLKIGNFEILNCGYNKGFSVLDIIKNFEIIIKKKIKTNIKERREGDVERIRANSNKLIKFTGKSYKSDILKSLRNSLFWENKI